MQDSVCFCFQSTFYKSLEVLLTLSIFYLKYSVKIMTLQLNKHTQDENMISSVSEI